MFLPFILVLALALALAPGSSLGGSALEPGSGSNWAPLVDALPCADEIGSRLSEWSARPEAFRVPSGLDGADRYRIPTSELGVWITLEAASGGRVRLFRNTAEAGAEWDFDASCEVSKREVPGLAGASGRRFTDVDLKALVHDNDRLVVYLWTPHLPLSVEGYHQIVEATSSSPARAALIAVVDPSAEPDYVREVADAEGIPADARRQVASIELLFRNLAVHAPAILVFDRGRAHPVLPGYRSAKAYREYLNGLER